MSQEVDAQERSLCRVANREGALELGEPVIQLAVPGENAAAVRRGAPVCFDGLRQQPEAAQGPMPRRGRVAGNPGVGARAHSSPQISRSRA